MNKDLLSLLAEYKTPEEAVELVKKTKVVFLVGVSGAGKDTVLRELLKRNDYKLIISHTTRKPRLNHGELEQDGVHYHFIDEIEAERMLQQKEFIEAKQYSGNIYGTSIAEIRSAYEQNKIAISDIEIQGVAHYRSIADNVTPIFLLPPVFETWQKRLKSRYQSEVDEEDLRERLATAKIELQEALSKDYYEYVINDDLAQTVQIVDEIAHGNFSREKNDQAKRVAEKLLEKL